MMLMERMCDWTRPQGTQLLAMFRSSSSGCEMRKDGIIGIIPMPIGPSPMRMVILGTEEPCSFCCPSMRRKIPDNAGGRWNMVTRGWGCSVACSASTPPINWSIKSPMFIMFMPDPGSAMLGRGILRSENSSWSVGSWPAAHANSASSATPSKVDQPIVPSTLEDKEGLW